LVLDRGSVLQVGSVREVFDEPRTRRVAEITGADNLGTATVTSLDGAVACLDWDGETLRVPGLVRAPGDEISFIIRPDELDVLQPPAAVPLGSIAGTVVRTRTRGRDVLIQVRLGNGRTLRAVTRGDHVVGSNAVLVPRPGAFWVIEPAHATTVSPAGATPRKDRPAMEHL
jgi:ABC-type Fe3+/spermidine/putrescine transport system ATPase subunit